MQLITNDIELHIKLVCSVCLVVVPDGGFLGLHSGLLYKVSSARRGALESFKQPLNVRAIKTWPLADPKQNMSRLKGATTKQHNPVRVLSKIPVPKGVPGIFLKKKYLGDFLSFFGVQMDPVFAT